MLFSCEIYEIFKNTFSREHLWTTASRKGYVCDELTSLISFGRAVI